MVAFLKCSWHPRQNLVEKVTAKKIELIPNTGLDFVSGQGLTPLMTPSKTYS